MDFTGVKVLDNIIIDYKEDLEINDKYNKCMNELKDLNRSHIEYSLEKEKYSRHINTILIINNKKKRKMTFISEEIDSDYSQGSDYTGLYTFIF